MITEGWTALIASLLLVLVSFLSSRFALEKTIRQVDADDYSSPGGCWSLATDACNLLAGLACILGIGLVLVFAFLNLRGLHGI